MLRMHSSYIESSFRHARARIQGSSRQFHAGGLHLVVLGIGGLLVGPGQRQRSARSRLTIGRSVPAFRIVIRKASREGAQMSMNGLCIFALFPNYKSLDARYPS